LIAHDTLEAEKNEGGTLMPSSFLTPLLHDLKNLLAAIKINFINAKSE